jgi:hypothetical protein
MQKTQKINKVRAFHGAIEVLEKAEQRKKASIKAWLSFLQMQKEKTGPNTTLVLYKH